LVNVWDLARLRLAGFITGSKIGRIAGPQKTLPVQAPGTITALLSAQALHSSGKDVAAQYCLSGHMLHGRIQV
jgi:hypothetical protein